MDPEVIAAWDRIRDLEDRLERIGDLCTGAQGETLPGLEEIAREVEGAWEEGRVYV